MLDPQKSRFWQATVLSGLMDAQSLTACWQAISPEKRNNLENLDRRLAKQAIQLKMLTVWQAQQLLAGRSSGYKVDRYVLLDLIGQGGMGRVYLARDTRLIRQVALKVLSPERLNNPRSVARFQREARVGAQLQHENLVRIYDFGESNGRFFLVMEYIDGKTIGTLISEQGHLSPAMAARLTQQVAQGLEHAYLKGLIHRDVNPYNILVTRDGTAKLADLGLAIDVSEGDHVTHEGATVGTFDYVAPEQARQSHAADIRSDIYSLGCSIYHMCTGDVPFPSSSLPEKLFAHQALEPKRLDQVVPDFPAGLAAVVHRMMRKIPDERYATPMQVVHALEAFTEEFTIPTVLKTTPAGKQSVPASQAAAEKPLGHGPGEVKAMPPSFPAGESEGSDGELPLFVDLGPEPLLSEGLSRFKPRSSLDNAVLSTSASTPRRRLSSLRLWGLAVLTTGLLTVFGLLAIISPLGSHPAATSANSHSPSITVIQSISKAQPVAVSLEKDAAITVRGEGETKQNFAADKLLEAVQTAMGSHGWVELQNREPIHLTSDQPLNFTSAQGRLIIRAAHGFKPVLEIELNGAKPLLTTGSAVALEMSGVTFNITYSKKQLAVSVPAVVVTAGSATIDRCAFQITGDYRPKGSSAVVSNGGVLKIDRSWFRGFDEAINIIAMNRKPARIQQTMIVADTRSARNQGHPTDWYGWGIKLQLGAGGTPAKKHTTPHLILEHCTVENTGLLDLTSTKDPSIINIEVISCAVRAEALLGCRRSSTPSTQILWHGRGNQYDILGPIWIVLSAKEGTPAFSSAVTDLKSWSLFASDERIPIGNKLEFLNDTKGRIKSAQPNDFTIRAPTSSQIRPGADPHLVGPWSDP